MAFATLEVFRVRYKAFCGQFGRDPAPDEPLFFDPSQEQPVPPESEVIEAQVVEAAAAARVDARLVLDFMRMSRRRLVPDPAPDSSPETWRDGAKPDCDDQADWLLGPPGERLP